MKKMKSEGLRRCSTVAINIVVAGGVLVCTVPSVNAQHQVKKDKRVLGRETIIALYGDYGKDVPSQNFIATGSTWPRLLKNTVENGSDNIASHLEPVLSIDEFGFDYDGGIDQKTAQVLKAAKKKNPQLKIAVWQMRGPAAPKLAATYRDTVDLLMMESYASTEDAWLIVSQLQAARLNGLSDRTIIGLGIGAEVESLGGHYWTRTKEELEQQIRLIRFVAPESPGVAFFGNRAHYGRGKEGVTIALNDVEDVCGRFRDFPTDGSGLRPELLDLAKTLTRRYEKPALVCSPSWVQPNFSAGELGSDGKWTGFGSIPKPVTFRALMMNLGDEDAQDVKVRLRNPGKDGDIFATGQVDVIPAKSVTVAIMPMIQGHKWKTWTGRWKLLVDAPGCEVLNYNYAHFGE